MGHLSIYTVLIPRLWVSFPPITSKCSFSLYQIWNTIIIYFQHPLISWRKNKISTMKISFGKAWCTLGSLVHSIEHSPVAGNRTFSPGSVVTFCITYGGGLVAKSCPTLVTPWTVACRLLCPWDFPGKNTRVGCHFLLQFLVLHIGSI